MPIHTSSSVFFEQDVSEAQGSDFDDALHSEPSQLQAGPILSIPEDAVVDDSVGEEGAHDLPSFLSAPSARVRRRSELAFTRPSKPIFDDRTDKGAFELPVMAAGKTGSSSVAPYMTSDDPIVTKIDVETPGASLGTTPVPSLRYSEDASLNHPSAAQRAQYRRYGRIHFFACCWCFFLEGWNDGTTGPLLPVIQRYYHVGFAVVALIFVLNCVGFVIGAFLNVHLNDKFGFGKVMVLGSLCQLATYVILVPAGPFPLMVIAYGLAGFGMALQNACANGFVGSLNKDTATKLGFLHGSYGIGACIAPLAATHFAQTKHWSYHFLISLGLAVSNTAVLAAVFRFRTQDEIMAEAGHEPGELSTGSENKYRQIMGVRVVHYLALFALIYIGVEVTLGGWIVTFIIQERQGGANAGYISSGFFGGLTIGRIGLIWLNRMIGERSALFLYAIIAIGLEITVWVVPSLIENAVAVSLIGVLMGPMYPILVNHTKSILPAWMLTGSVGWITGIGQAGSAALPFLAGVLASKFGISSMQPLVVSMMGVMIVVWVMVSRVQRRID